MADDRLSGRRILVTGASSGIGRATAIALVEAGAKVALLARSRGALADLAGDIGGVIAAADVTDDEQVEAAVAESVDALGGLDGLVNAAGVSRHGLVDDGDQAEWQLMFDVNVLGLLRVTRLAVPHLRANEVSDVVNVGSMSGRRVASVAGAVYASTKFAVHAVSEGLRRELRSDGVRVSVVAPGLVADTDIASGLDPDDRERVMSRQDHLGLPVDWIAQQILWILSAPPRAGVVEIASMSPLQE